jgi:non-homologous end joining protein Ku
VPVLVEMVLLLGNMHYVNVGRRHPGTNVFQHLEQHLRETGSVKLVALVIASRPRTVRTPSSEDGIIAAVESEPW